MKTFVALLRGINVGGHHKVPMADLRALLEKLKFKDAKTYIQSGNVVFKYEDAPTTDLANRISEVIEAHFGFTVKVFVLSILEFEALFLGSPFSDLVLQKSYFMILDKELKSESIETFSKLSNNEEHFEIKTNCIYFYAKNGYGIAKFTSNFFEKKLKVNITTRNYKTMLKIVSMAKEIENNP